jgi:hypothetical protein
MRLGNKVESNSRIQFVSNQSKLVPRKLDPQPLSKVGLTLNLQVARVDWSVTEHLSTHGRADPRGGLRYFWRPNKT